MFKKNTECFKTLVQYVVINDLKDTLQIRSHENFRTFKHTYSIHVSAKNSFWHGIDFTFFTYIKGETKERWKFLNCLQIVVSRITSRPLPYNPLGFFSLIVKPMPWIWFTVNINVHLFAQWIFPIKKENLH